MFPELLTNKKQWLLWKYEQHESEKKPRKVPYYSNGHRRVGRQGDENDLANLVDYNTAKNALDFGDYTGLGLALIKGDGLICVDIDSNADKEQIDKIISGLNSYTEISPSGNGYHIWLEGETRTFKNNDVGIEVFSGSQFITMTENAITNSCSDVKTISPKAIDGLYEIVKGRKREDLKPKPQQTQTQNELQKIETALSSISSECGYDDWYRVGAAIYSELGESGFDIWDYWSKKSSKYNSTGMYQKYRSFANITDINIATLYKMAIDQGWKPPRDPNYKPEQKNKPEPLIIPKDENLESDTPKQKSFGNEHFKFLGYNRDSFYIFQFEKNQVCELKKSDLSETGFLTLAPQQFWVSHFGDGKKIFDKKAAADWFIRVCYRTGFYDAETIRGRGAWWDNGRPVFHFGSHLSVDGEIKEVSDIESNHIYEIARPMKTKKVNLLTKEDGRKILNTAKMFRWQKPASAPLLCGWMFLSRICGSLSWRPHIWITGESGSGKTTIMNSFIYPLLGNDIVFAQGNSTEAGIRQKLKNDALPVLFDEAESNNEREQNRIQNILSLVRQSSTDSGAHTLKGTATGEAMQFYIRSMFMLSSIQVQILMQADIERITVLNLIPKRTENASDNWERLSKSLLDIGLDRDISDRLFTRSLVMLPKILKNIDVFRVAAAKHFGTVREGDQFGTLLAGCWSMCEDKEATEQEATEMINKLDWSEYMDNAEDTESKKTLSSILESKIRIPHGEASLFEVINIAVNGVDMGQGVDLSQNEAHAVLQRNGLKLENDCLLISNNTNSVNSMLKGSQYQADWRGQILRIDGITKHSKAVRFNGVVSKCLRVELSLLGL
jgi:GTPase SAR1 family protein